MVYIRQIIRLFVSSTFRDLHIERNALQRYVFPALRELCSQRGARFQAIDLRWGISQEASKDQRTMTICFDEIHRCRAVSPDVNFLILLGDRYGSRFLPESIPTSEYKTLKVLMKSTESEALEAWYKEDLNAIPHAYVLQPRTGDYLNYTTWLEVEERLHTILAAACKRSQLPVDAQLKYLASATHQEIYEGVPGHKGDPSHALCAFRTITGDPTGPNVATFVETDADAIDRLNALKSEISRRLSGQIMHYEAPWSADGPVVDIEAFCSAMLALLTPRVEAALEQREFDRHADLEVRGHDLFTYEHTRHFIGRAVPLRAIATYLNGKDANPLVVTGPSGSGKSTLLAKAVEMARAKQPSAEIITRYIGVTPGTSNLRVLLKSLCEQITRSYGGYETTVPGDESGMMQEFPRQLERATAQKPLILFIDALDQLSDITQPATWLPTTLPPHVRLVVSIAQDRQEFMMLRQQLPAKQIVTLDPMTVNEGEKLLNLWLSEAQRTLQVEQRKAVLSAFQQQGLPLYLRMAFQEARRWPSFSPVKPLKPSITGLLHDLFARLAEDGNHGPALVAHGLGFLHAAKNGLSEDEMLDVLSTDKTVLADIKRLSPDSPELDPKLTFPLVLWSRLYFDLEPYLTERRADGTTLHTFYHRQLRDAVAYGYLKGKDKIKCHRALAAYFWKQQLVIGQDLPNLRKLSELPFQEAEGKLWGKLYKTLTNFRFLELKAAMREMEERVPAEGSIASTAMGVYLLQEDFDYGVLHWQKMTEKSIYQASVAYSTSIDSRLQVLAAFQRAIRREANVLVERPHLLWQQLYNRLKWEDKPIPQMLAEELEVRSVPGTTPWLRLRAPLPESQALILTLSGHTDSITRCVFSPDDTTILSGSEDGTLKLWDVRTGRTLATLIGHTGWVEDCVFSPDGSTVLSASRDHTLKLWDARSGKECMTLSGHNDEVNACAFSQDGTIILSASDDRTLKLWDAKSGQELATLSSQTGQVTACAFSPDPDGATILAAGGGHLLTLWDAKTRRERVSLHTYVRNDPSYILTINPVRVPAFVFSPDGSSILSSGSHDQALKLWDAKTGQERATLNAGIGEIRTYTFSPNGAFILAGGSDGTLKLWNAVSRQMLAILHGHTAQATACAFSPDSTIILSGSEDGILKLWDTATGQEITTLRGHTSKIVACTFSPDGSYILSASDDHTLKLWDARLDQKRAMQLERTDNAHIVRERTSLIGHSGKVLACAFSPDSTTILSGGQEGTLKLWDTRTGRALATLSDRDAPVNLCAFSPDGNIIVSASSDVYVDDHSLTLWDARGGQKLALLTGHTSYIYAFTFSPDGSIIASASDDHTLRLWDVHTGEERATLQGHTDRVWACAFSPDGSFLVSASDDGTLKQWNTATGEELATFTGHTDEVRSCTISSDGTTILSSGRDHTLRLWDVATGRELVTITEPTGEIGLCAFSPDSETILSTSKYGVITLWETKTGRKRAVLLGHSAGVTACVFSPDSTYVLSASSDCTLKLWNAKTSELLDILIGHSEGIEACAFHPDGTMILSASSDSTLKLWDMQVGQEREILTGHTDHVWACNFSADGCAVVSGSEDCTLKLWDAETAQVRVTLFSSQHFPVNHCAFSPDSRTIISFSSEVYVDDHSLTLWDAYTGRQLALLSGHSDTVHACTFSPDSSTIASASGDSTLKLWNARTGEELTTLRGHNEHVWDCAFSPDGSSIVSASWDKTLKVWDTTTRQELMTLIGHTNSVLRCAFSPDGTTILSSGDDGTIRLWDVRTGRERIRLVDYSSQIGTCIFSPDGMTILSTHYNDILRSAAKGTLILWDARTRRRLTTLTGHPYGVEDCAFSPDGRTIISVGYDGTLKVWDARTGREHAILPLLGPLGCLAVHPWQPYIVCGDAGGNMYFIDLVGITYGPKIVTAVNRGRGPEVRCPKCQHIITEDKVQLGRTMTCPQPECAIPLHINPFVVIMGSSIQSSH